MNTKVSAFLAGHNFVRHADINTIAESVLEDMNCGLLGKDADQDMIRARCLPPDDIITDKKVIVIDAGGTNFRSCLVSFDKKGKAEISNLEKTKMAGIEKELNKKEFFNCFAKNLEHLKNQADSIGFCFSYPMKITNDGDGILLGFSKEIKAPEVVGCKIGECLKEALEENGWSGLKRITLLNDTVAALLAGAAACIEGKKYSSYIGLILGTGMNTAYIQPAIPNLDNFPKQIVVCESGKTRKVIRSDFDVSLDKKTVKPGTFFMEKLCSGAYLGSLALEMLHTAASERLFNIDLNRKILEIKSLSLIEMDAFLHAPYDRTSILGKIAAESAEDSDYDIIYRLLDAVVERSARHAAAILTAAVIQSGGGKEAVKPVCILCNGTTFYKTYMIKDRVMGYLDEVLTKQRGLYWEIISRDNDITLGTAIAGLIDRR